MYFEQASEKLDSGSEDMNFLLDILPGNLKIPLVKFIHKDAIKKIPLLQNRPDSFYLNYMEKFTYMRFDFGETLYEKG
jgi:hypothetical protein